MFGPLLRLGGFLSLLFGSDFWDRWWGVKLLPGISSLLGLAAF